LEIYPPANCLAGISLLEFIIWCLTGILKNFINKYFAELSSALPRSAGLCQKWSKNFHKGTNHFPY
jgi:hypothetical protein